MAQLISRPTTPGYGAPGYAPVRAFTEPGRAAPAPYARREAPVKTAPAPVFSGDGDWKVWKNGGKKVSETKWAGKSD